MARALKRTQTVSAETVVIFLGINDLISGRGVEEVASDLKLISTRFMERGVKVIAVSPVVDQKYARLNELVRAYCQVSGCAYADLAAVAGPDDTSDGVHLTRRGYRKLVETLRPLIDASG